MSGRRRRRAVMMLLFCTAACTPGWHHTGGNETLSRARYTIAPPAAAPSESGWRSDNPGRMSESRKVAFVVPAGWHWYERGQDLIATKDGVFLQQIFVERIHRDQLDQDILGVYHRAGVQFEALSAKQWPTRTVESLKKRFVERMLPADAADVLIESRRNDPSVTDLKVRKIVTRSFNDRQAFRAEFDFRLKNSVLNPFLNDRRVSLDPTPALPGSDLPWKDPEHNPSPLYRTTYCGFMIDEWFYGISYTAALRYYFEKDVATFEAFLDSVRVLDE
jgi:hypothetical protein